ncbi:hypothetical protein L1987_11603 [Smallanthus sonchifolius]|uniref:Uncharacterized protein n=1 Tax=Smallanthus sonchifolius TaxID=185202 RepID=A0ACB9JE21_9ASTR|nr:hypothetical protein L1987_11603 [Smallanthus sonchifolius]
MVLCCGYKLNNIREHSSSSDNLVFRMWKTHATLEEIYQNLREKVFEKMGEIEEQAKGVFDRKEKASTGVIEGVAGSETERGYGHSPHLLLSSTFSSGGFLHRLSDLDRVLLFRHLFIGIIALLSNHLPLIISCIT